MPAVQVLYTEELQAASIDVVGVSQFRTTEAATSEFVDRTGLSFPNFFDESAKLADAYGVGGVPSYVFLDKEGLVAYTSSGARGTDLIRSLLTDLNRE